MIHIAIKTLSLSRNSHCYVLLLPLLHRSLKTQMLLITFPINMKYNFYVVVPADKAQQNIVTVITVKTV